MAAGSAPAGDVGDGLTTVAGAAAVKATSSFGVNGEDLTAREPVAGLRRRRSFLQAGTSPGPRVENTANGPIVPAATQWGAVR